MVLLVRHTRAYQQRTRCKKHSSVVEIIWSLLNWSRVLCRRKIPDSNISYSTLHSNNVIRTKETRKQNQTKLTKTNYGVFKASV